MCTVIAYHDAVPSRVKVPRVIAMRVSFQDGGSPGPSRRVGDAQNFTLFLQLLDTEVYADVTYIRRAMEKPAGALYVRRPEAMVFSPSGRPGRMARPQGFQQAHPHSVERRAISRARSPAEIPPEEELEEMEEADNTPAVRRNPQATLDMGFIGYVTVPSDGLGVVAKG